MGSCTSEFGSFTPNDKIVGQDNVAADVFRKMKLRRGAINELYRLFRSLDRANTGFIAIGDLFASCGIECKPLTLRMMSIFRTCTEETQIHFMEMVCAVSIFLSKFPIVPFV